MLLQGLMDQPDLEGSPEHPPGDDACLWIVPVALQCGRQRVGGVGFGSAASDRIDPATE